MRIIAIVILTLSFITVFNTDLRSQVRSALLPQYRVILAVASSDLGEKERKFQVLKVKTDQGIFVEVYNERLMLASAKLPDHKDGYFTFNGQVTNLAIDDIDDDKKLEILATSFDNDLVAHLNIYRYVPGKKDLELVRLN